MMTDDARSKLNTKVQIARRHQPFILDDPDRAWCILAGSADVFSSVVEKGVAVGTRRRQGHLGVGDAVFTVEDTQAQQPIRLMLLATADVELLAIPISHLDAASTETGKSPRDLIESGVAKVGELRLWPKPPPTANRVDAPGQRTCQIGQSLRPERDHVSWVRIDAGSARFHAARSSASVAVRSVSLDGSATGANDCRARSNVNRRSRHSPCRSFR